jgi:hypothetical protein
VTLVDKDRQRIKASCGAHSGIDLPREHVFCNYTILHDEVFVAPDAWADQTFAPNPYVVGEPHIPFYAGAPLTIQPGIRLGALCVTDSKPRDLCPEEAELLRGLGRLVGFCRNILFQSFSYGDHSYRSGDTDVQGQVFRSSRDPALRVMVHGLQSEPEGPRGDDG